MPRREKAKKAFKEFTGDVRQLFGRKDTSKPSTPSSEKSHTNASAPEVDMQTSNVEVGVAGSPSIASATASPLNNPQPNDSSSIDTRPGRSVPSIHLPQEGGSGMTVPYAGPYIVGSQAALGIEMPSNQDTSNSQETEPTYVDEAFDTTKSKEANSATDQAPRGSYAAPSMRKSLKELARVLGPVTGLFGPIKEVVGVIEACVDTYEMAGVVMVEYDGIRVQLEATIQDLKIYFEGGHSLTMTTSMASICGSIKAELDKIRSKLEKNRVVRPLGVSDEVDAITRSYQRIEIDLQRLTLNANWETMKDVKEQAASARIDRLSPSLSARYNSAEADDELKRHACTPGTRIRVLDEMLRWAHSDGDGSIFWLNGMAGTGKTTIAYSLCDELQAEHKLAASFFCSRLREECRTVKRIIPSIAYQLARFSLPFLSVVSAALQKDLDVHSSLLSVQFDELIAKPLQATKDTLPKGLVIVIDALDECENQNSNGLILDILLNKAADLPIRFLVSSRPETEIRDRMTDERIKSRLVLHELEKGEVQADIETYLRVGLAFIKLSEEDIAELVARAGILFIYAATVVRYIGYDNFQSDPRGRLGDILEGRQSLEDGGSEEMDNLYTTILEGALGNRRLRKTQRDDMRRVLDTVVCAREPLTVGGLSELLGVKDVERVRTALRPLWSVLHVVRGSELVTTLHASFPEFMLDSTHSKTYWCDSNTHHRNLAEHCFDCMVQTKPQFNICALESSYVFDEDVPDIEKRVANAISSELSYACRYWADHLKATKSASGVIERIRDFLSARLLLWMEILNLKNQMKAGIECIKLVVEWCRDVVGEEELAELAQDAKRFVEAFASNPVSRSTPHLYLSMLAFWPKSASIAKHYANYTRGPVEVEGTALDQRQLAHLSTWGFEKAIEAISVSPDGQHIALAVSSDVVIVDSTSGRVILGPLQGYPKNVVVKTVAFSPDGFRILAGSIDEQNATILVWETRSGDEVLGPLQLCGHRSNIYCLNFSPDCFRIATGSRDQTIRLWSAQTGEALLQLQAQRWVRAAVFSPDGTRVAAAYGKTLQVWDSQSGDTILGPVTVGGLGSIHLIALSPDNSSLICAHDSDTIIQAGDVQSDGVVFRQIGKRLAYMSCIAYSPDGKHVVSGSDDRTIRIWDTRRGHMVLDPLVAHTDMVNAVAFSPDGSRIISACRDGLVCTWDTQQYGLNPSPANIPDYGITCVKFSSDGTQFASGSRKGEICIWDTGTGEIVTGPVKVHTGQIIAIDFKNNHVASGSDNREMCICDARSGEVVLGPFEGQINAVAYSPDGELIATGSSAGVEIWDAQDGSWVLGPLTDLDGHVLSIQFSPDGGCIVAGSGAYSSNIVVWAVSDGQNMFGILDGHNDDWVLSVSYSRDGASIASGDNRGRIILWDAYNGKKVIHLRTIRHSGGVYSVCFSPDSTRLVSASYDKTIRIWDVQTGEILFRLEHEHEHAITSVEYSPDGTYILSRSADMSVRIHDARSPEERALLRLESEVGDWSIDKDGWLVDDQSRLLVWVPGDLRKALMSSTTYILVAPQGYVSLKFDKSRTGESWARSFISNL